MLQRHDFAKDVHKRCQSAASDKEALALLDLVQQRYPSSAARLAEWRASLAAWQGDLNALLAPLNDLALPAEKQTAITAHIRRGVIDLRALADCTVLPAEHPLRIGPGTASVGGWRYCQDARFSGTSAAEIRYCSGKNAGRTRWMA